MNKLRTCPRCGHNGVYPEDRYCERCGAPLPKAPPAPPERRCPHCGRILSQTFIGDFCEHCGRRLAEAPKPPAPPRTPEPVLAPAPREKRPSEKHFSPPTELDL